MRQDSVLRNLMFMLAWEHRALSAARASQESCIRDDTTQDAPPGHRHVYLTTPTLGQAKSKWHNPTLWCLCSSTDPHSRASSPWTQCASRRTQLSALYPPAHRSVRPLWLNSDGNGESRWLREPMHAGNTDGAHRRRERVRKGEGGEYGNWCSQQMFATVPLVWQHTPWHFIKPATEGAAVLYVRRELISKLKKDSIDKYGHLFTGSRMRISLWAAAKSASK